MASNIVWTCKSGGSTAAEVTPLNTQRPTCPTGQGAYVAVSLPDAPFDPSQLSTSELASAWAAGFTVMATGLVIAAGLRLLVRAVREAFN